MLRRAGHHVEEVGSASEALRLLKSNKFDLLPLEIKFLDPGKNHEQFWGEISVSNTPAKNCVDRNSHFVASTAVLRAAFHHLCELLQRQQPSGD
jgi:hypothetical protein